MLNSTTPITPPPPPHAKKKHINNIIGLTQARTLLTFRSLKKTVFRAQSTCENRFWSSTLHISSNTSTSHWLYDWLCSSENSCCCHSRSSTDWTNSRIIGDTLGKFKLFEFFQFCFLLLAPPDTGTMRGGGMGTTRGDAPRRRENCKEMRERERLRDENGFFLCVCVVGYE